VQGFGLDAINRLEQICERVGPEPGHCVSKVFTLTVPPVSSGPRSGDSGRVKRGWHDGRMAHSLIGRLLLASPRLIDPNFFRTVVLVCGHDDEGAFGLVLNSPSDIAVGDHLPGWVERLRRPDVVFSGGPVQPDTAMGIGLKTTGAPIGWSPVAGDVGLVDLTLPPGDVVGHIAALRVFSGYAGWGSGQLDAEIAGRDWVVAVSSPEDCFGDAPGGLWRAVLRRQEGGAALYAHFPLDPRDN